MRAIGRDPIFIARGEGSTIVDVDGNEYVDWVSSWGPLIAGHAHPGGGRRGRLDRHRRNDLRSADQERGDARGRGGVPDSVGRDAADDLLGDRGDDERDPPRARGTGRERDPEVRGRLPRPRRRAAGRGRLGARDAGDPGEPGRAARRRRGDRDRAVERPRGARSRRPSGSSSRRSSPSRCPPTWAWSRPPTASSSCCASAPTTPGRCSIFDEVITGFRVARGGAQERYGVIPDLTILGKIIGGGLPAAAYGGAARADGADRPGGRRLPGRDAGGQPARGRGGAGDARAARRRAPTSASSASPTRLADGLAKAAADAGVPLTVQHVTGLVTPFFSAGPVRRLRGRGGLRSRCLRRVVPGAARARRVPAGVAVRGLVPVARAHRRRPRADARGGARGVRGDRGVSRALFEALRARGGTLGECARSAGGRRRAAAGAAADRRPPARGPRDTRPSTSCCSR